MSTRMTGSPTRSRAAAAITAAAALLAGLLSTAPGASAAPPSTGDKIQQQLDQAFEAETEQDFWVRFDAEADLGRAARARNRDIQGRMVYKALQSTARDSQADVIASLRAADVGFESFSINNSIYVHGGTEELAETLAERGEVRTLEKPQAFPLEKPINAEQVKRVQTVEWGIANIRADEAWEEFGSTGEGIVVANIDSGVQYDHPAVVDSYRGNLGGGSFDHDYNWVDPSNVCGDPSLEPCDNNDHGTHTMGTMVGDDGAGNQIGVAPDATWIAAKGCELSTCSDLALTASAEWIVAPTDLNGENPDPTKRPHIVNNSWGGPGGDEWYEPYVDAWVAAGIFPQFSNGNSGPGCDTAGAPGEYAQSYAAGAYDVNNAIASFSSRGPGVGDDIKPNLSAPGVAVRSSTPGDGYASFSGTSMASPHVAGTIALMWSAAPSLVGDIDATRELLDGSAVDTADDQCGGTDEDNNVFGEGRLDAFAAVEAAPRGDSGELTGTVTDASTGDPVDGAEVSVTGAGERSTTTDDDGTYSINLLAGSYDLTADKFGYETASVSGLDVVAGETTTQDVALAPAESATLSGLVRDGSGHGWPLYAKVSVDGVPEASYTNPANGRFSIDLPAGASYEVTIESEYPGYETLTETVEMGSGDQSQDFGLTVDAEQCNAPGYTLNYDGLLENFDTEESPEGWTVVDNAGTGQVWEFDDPGARGNLTGGDGGFAVIDSDEHGPGGEQDTSLVSPVFDLTGIDSPALEFATDYNDLGAEMADVDMSLDGGETWTNVWRQETDLRGPAEVSIPLAEAANQSEVQLRWHYYVGSYDWWWQVDEVFVGNKTCDKVRGGLLWGTVEDFNTGAAINGATVTSVDVPEDAGRSMPTPDDDQLGDGFYWMFSSVTGQHRFVAEKGEYRNQRKRARIAADWTTRKNFRLRAGQLEAVPTDISEEVPMGESEQTTFEMTNTGTAPATFELTERDRGFVILNADGSRTRSQSIAKAGGTEVNRVKAPVSPLQNAPRGVTRAQADAPVVPHDEPWMNITDYPSNIMDNAVAVSDGKVYSFGGTEAGLGATDAAFVYDPATLAWEEIASMPEGRQMPAAAFVDGKFYAVGGWGGGGGATVAETAIYDPASDSWSTGADNPTPWAAAGTAVLDGKIYAVGGCGSACGETDVVAYDTASDSFETLADYPEATSWLACGGISGQVYCAGGNSGATGESSAYAYDPGADEWTAIADLPTDVWAGAYSAANDQLLLSGGVAGGLLTNEGWAYDPATDAWTALPNSNNTVYRGGAACGFYKIGGSTGNFAASPFSELLPGFEDCGGAAADVPWLSEDPTSGTLAPGESVTVTVTLDASQVAQPGAYQAQLNINEDTPYGIDPVDVTMNATPPQAWGKLMGLVEGRSCDSAIAPIDGATLQIDGSAGGSWTLVTEDDGSYARWLHEGQSPLTLIAAKDGYAPQFRMTNLIGGQTNAQDFLLREAAC